MALVFLFFILKICHHLIYASNEFSPIYYSAPNFSVKNANVTFGFNRKVAHSESNFIFTIGETLASICQAQKINQKKATSSMNGIMNLVFQDFDDLNDSGQDASIGILSNNLYFSKNNSKLNQAMNVELTGIFGGSNFGTSKINSQASNSFALPFVSAGNLALNDPDNQFSGQFLAQNSTFYEVLEGLDYSTFNAVISTLLYFNWTLVGSVFAANSYGYDRQQRVQLYSESNKFPYFTCNFISGILSPLSHVEEACKCITEKSSINVIVLWMTTNQAYELIKQTRSQCKASEKWTFIISNDENSIISYQDTEELKNSLIFRTFGPWDFSGFVDDCIQNTTPALADTLDELFSSYNEVAFNCVLNNIEGLDQCPENIYNRTEKCICTNKEFGQDPYTNAYFYVADTLNLYTEGINLIQNNCTFLSQQLKQDYCALTEFSPFDLSRAMRFVNFTGYTGNIQFDIDQALIRLYKSSYLYNTINTPANATLVGVFNYTGFSIDTDLIQFLDGKIPISRIVPQNPDLSYAIVCVFFGLAIAEMIVCFVLLVIFVLNFNSKVIRQSGALLNITMLAATFFMALSQLLLCMSRTDATCTLVLYVFRASLILLLSALLFKNYRVYRIFGNKSANALKITESSLLVKVFIITFIYVAVITVFVAVFGFKAITFQSTKDYYYQFVKCEIPNETWNIIYEFFLQLTAIALIILTLILAWLTRKAQSDYNESVPLAAFSGIIAAVLLIFVPLALTLGDDSGSEIFRFIILAEFISIVVVSACVLLFIPKAFVIYKRKKTARAS